MAKLNFFICLFGFWISFFDIQTECFHGHRLLKRHRALFIFGDSQFDPGNNNYFNTTSKADFWPYGETFFHYPTGRFSDGLLVPDFIAEYAKLPLIPPYLQPGDVDQFIFGANFASGGAGALKETRAGLVIDLKTQLGYFKNVSRLLRQKLGDEEAESLVSRAVYLFSIGGNDYLFPFETNSSIPCTFSVEQFVGQVMGNITQVVKEIYKVGGRKFGFPSLWPLECLPFTRRLELEGGKKDACFEPIKPYKEEHNKQLPKLLQKLQSDLKGFKYSFPDFHTLLKQLINHPSKYGFKEGKVACCGSGPYKGILSCGGKRDVAEYYLCDNVTEYLFFDSAHPTERANRLLAQLAWSGEPNITGPYNLKALFES
ncbi:GDSL esterase/lipase 1 isoform X1 [Ziziphus jujuba]|uniref:GDSL esterase/lipase 1 isoform X1 n=1 Tax=Ziziphus jujuba TaxID=326968 RepID=A0A6P4AT42_ZIZJJ|nr:GDSL esterase/lipase 1 isoform X1 [Ziziphus jujuba]